MQASRNFSQKFFFKYCFGLYQNTSFKFSCHKKDIEGIITINVNYEDNSCIILIFLNFLCLFYSHIIIIICIMQMQDPYVQLLHYQIQGLLT